MRILLDTHSFLWFVSDDAHLSTTARSLMEDGGNELLLSMASVWEIAIKVSLGKLSLDQPLDSFLPTQLEHNDIDILPIELSHSLKVAALPFSHRDPFDRMLIAQSLVEELPILGADQLFDLYGVRRLW